MFVRTAPDSGLPAGKWEVSIAGTMPQWQSGTPVQLFTARRGVSLRNHFTASADGQRFLFTSPRDAGNSGEVHVILNWPAPLKKN